jgi:hypothetical protein
MDRALRFDPCTLCGELIYRRVGLLDPFDTRDHGRIEQVAHLHLDEHLL